MDEAPFVERMFELEGAALPVRFYLPFKAPGGEFQCRWSIGWPEREVSRRACGEDGVQSLMLAMKSAHFELVESAEHKAGLLTLWGQGDLDLPPSWGVGPLYDAGPPPPAA